MNPAFYANTPNANVDWAQLAAQWIHMRETLPSDQLTSFPDAPPPPSITLLDHSSDGMSKRLQDEEKGEAPMEVEKDEDDIVPSFDTSINQAVPMIAPQPPVIQQWSSGMGLTPNSNVWSNPPWQMFEQPSVVTQPVPVNKPPPLCPELQGYTARKRYGNKSPHRDAFPMTTHTTEDPNEEEGMETLDAAKRKTLPAWIREGLEKMEREKQREEERIKMEELRQQREEERRKFEEEALNELESTKGLRSKFVSDLLGHLLETK